MSNTITPWLDSKNIYRNFLAIWFFSDNCTVTHSHLKPLISFHFDEKNYSFTCPKCNESIGSSFVTQDNKIPPIHLGYYGLGFARLDHPYYFDDYFSAFMENNISWFNYHSTWRMLKSSQKHIVKGCYLN